MTATRDTILAAIRSAADHAVALPPPYPMCTPDADPVGRFAAMLAAAAGRLVRVGSRRQVRSELELLSEVGPMLVVDDDLRPAQAAAPPRIEDLETCVVGAALAVAENGALWIDGDRVEPRAAVTLCRHLVVVVDAADLVADMHRAYARIDIAGGYGLFVSGASKTADVEQCLVIGAHGAIGLTCYLVG